MVGVVALGGSRRIRRIRSSVLVLFDCSLLCMCMYVSLNRVHYEIG